MTHEFSPHDRALLDAVRFIGAERIRQIAEEGWSAAHDDAHGEGELLLAARAYFHASEPALEMVEVPHHRTDASGYMDAGSEPAGMVRVPVDWPWDGKWWKPGDRRRNLEKAGALCWAEADRCARRGTDPTAARELSLEVVRALTALLEEDAAP